MTDTYRVRVEVETPTGERWALSKAVTAIAIDEDRRQNALREFMARTTEKLADVVNPRVNADCWNGCQHTRAFCAEFRRQQTAQQP